MAQLTAAAATLTIISLFFSCIPTQAKTRRFGSEAKTLHFPPLTEAEKWGNRFFILRADDANHSNTDKLLKRFVRDTSAPLPAAASVNITLAHLHNNSSMLIVHWAGAGSSVILALAKSRTQRRASNIFVSRDYGASFSDITQNVTAQTSSVVIDRFYNSELMNSHYVFTDSESKCIITTRDYAQTFFKVCNLLFRPVTVSLSPVNADHILAMDPDSSNTPLYLSHDFGVTWRFVRSEIKAFFWGVPLIDSPNTVYVEEKRGVNGNAVLRSSNYLYNENFVMIFDGAEDFEVQEKYMFVTKRVRLLGSITSETLQFWVSYNRGPFINAQFPVQHNHTDYYVADASEDQVMVCVTHGEKDTHLYISDINGTRFSLSLEHIVYYSPSGANNNTWLRFYSSATFADIHKVAGLRGIYIASQLLEVAGGSRMDYQRSLITYDKGGEWVLLNSPEQGPNCSKNLNCSLHLTQEFHRLHPSFQAQPILSTESAPGILMATGTLGANIKSENDLFVSADAGYSWHRVMDGSYIFTMADHGGIMVAVKQFQATDSIYYSIDEGQTWQALRFLNASQIFVYGLLTEPGEKTTVISLFGSYTTTHSWLLVQLNTTSVLGPPCRSEDYRDWSLPLLNPDNQDSGCLLGSRLVYSRRIANARCFNGQDFVRTKHSENCRCTRDDYECEFGFKLNDGTNMCEQDPDVPSNLVNPVPIPCPAGTYYSVSHGYRRVSGDTCSGGDAHKFEPLQYSCPIAERSEFVLVASNHRVSAIDLEIFESQDLISVWDGNSITAVAFDYKRNRLFWSTGNKIQAVYLSAISNRTQQTLAEGHMQSVSSLAYDWTADTLYWTDDGEKTIEVVHSNGTYRRKLFQNNAMIERPTRLLLDPHHGWMYWLDLEGYNQRIMKAWMDGTPSSLHQIGPRPLRGVPQGLALDFFHEKLYWTEAVSNTIQSMDLNGTSVRNVTLQYGAIRSPGPIDMYKNNLYWINNQFNQLREASDNSNGQGVSMTVKMLTDSVVDMRIISHTSQQSVGVCINASCVQLCLPRPNSNDASLMNRTCRCGDQYLPNLGGQSCSCAVGEIMDSNGECRHANASTCASSQFSCHNSRCIPSVWRCDHEDDCADNSDELNCSFGTCPTNQFKCANGRCIPLSWHCDFDNDCADLYGQSSDELNCTYPPCTSGQFRCTNGRCISNSLKCDFNNDCLDGVDEQNCTYRNNCYSWEFKCSNGQCISSSSKCDGFRNCRDGSDETNCSSQSCSSFQFRCSNGRCIYSAWICDEDNDCVDGSDEANCTAWSTAVRTSPTPCYSYQYQCLAGLCIDYTSICDGVNDCGDSEDEQDCDFPIRLTTASPCSSLEFNCPNGHCILTEHRCDGYNDCGDSSDELSCGDLTCPANHFRCNSTQLHCIVNAWVCDGQPDCPFGEDEFSCSGEASCPSNEFKCVQSEGCLPLSRRCNGFDDCADGSDEADCYKDMCEQFEGLETCCRGDCVFLDCPDERVVGCFKKTNVIGNSCSAANNNQCNKTSSQIKHNPALYFQCTSSPEWVLWMYVCNGLHECDNGADEMFCNGSLTSDLRMNSPFDIQDITANISWNLGRSTCDSYIVSYYESQAEASWQNKTANYSSYQILNLSPNTNYVVTVYCISRGGRVLYPVVPKEFTTKAGVPTPPRSVYVSVDYASLMMNVSWVAPVQANGKKISYLLKITNYQDNLVLIKYVDGKTYYLFSDAVYEIKYQFRVSAMNENYTSEWSEAKNATISAKYAPPTLNFDSVTNTSVRFTWNKINDAKSYRITAIFPYQDYRQINFTSNDTSTVFTNLCPAQNASFYLQAEFPDSSLTNPSPIQMVLAKGTTTPSVTNLIVSLNGAFSGIATFSPPSAALQVKCTIYYTDLTVQDTNDFLCKAKQIQIKSGENTVAVSGLNSCAKYMFRVGCGPDTCPLSAVVVARTKEDEKAPPKHLSSQWSNRTLVLKWDAPCDSLPIPLDYYIVGTTTDGKNISMIIGSPSNLTHLNYTFTNLVRGSSYVFKIRTTVGSSYSSDLLRVTIPPYAEPDEFKAIPLNSTSVVLTWVKPSDFPPNDLFEGYKLTIWHDQQVVETKTISTTFLIQNMTAGYSYNVSVAVVVKNSNLTGAPAFQSIAYISDDQKAADIVTLNSTKIVAIVTPVAVLILVLLVVSVVFVVRHRRLQRSFLAFASSHYNTRSGTTTFSDEPMIQGFSDDDEPMIQGFSDDEPLVLA